jgi:hypothetical protein
VTVNQTNPRNQGNSGSSDIECLDNTDTGTYLRRGIPEEVTRETAVFTRAEATEDYPDLTTDRELVDAATARMVLKPETLDVLNPLIVS